MKWAFAVFLASCGLPHGLNTIESDVDVIATTDEDIPTLQCSAQTDAELCINRCDTKIVVDNCGSSRKITCAPCQCQTNRECVWWYYCLDNHCARCGFRDGDVCCTGDAVISGRSCAGGLQCGADGLCSSCGGEREPCCSSGEVCSSAKQCVGDNICRSSGFRGLPCNADHSCEDGSICAHSFGQPWRCQ